MAIFIEVLEGPGEGDKWQISDGDRMGRATGEILIKDPKASGLHAQIEQNEKGQLILVDLKSTNGIRVNGQRVQKVAMVHGVRFHIGGSLFGVFEGRASVADGESKNWSDVLSEQIVEIYGQNSNESASVRPFDSVLELRVLRGPQADQIFHLGYGPRRFGSDVLDCELLDPAAPEIAFEIFPHEAGAFFQTDFPEIVLLNDQRVSSEKLNEGDQIRFGQTLIEVHFLK